MKKRILGWFVRDILAAKAEQAKRVAVIRKGFLVIQGGKK